VKKIILFIGLQFSTVATSGYNKIASDNHTIEASTLFSCPWLLLNNAEASEQVKVIDCLCWCNILYLLQVSTKFSN